MAKYKVGDKVIVRGDLDTRSKYYMADKSDYWNAVCDMLDWAGKSLTITVADCKYYRVKECNGNWTDEMFVGLAGETPMPKKPKKEEPKGFKVGDRVRAVQANWGTLKVGDLGTVVVVRGDDDCGVEFDNEVKGHDCDGNGKEGCCWWVFNHEIELVKEEPKPEPTPTPTPINVNITVNLYENSCWYCRKGGLVDLYLAGAMGICPNCKRVCNTTNALPKAHKPTNPWKKENKPLTNEELEALADGTRVFVLFKEYEGGKWTVDDWKSASTCWRTKQGNRLNRKQGHVLINENNISYTAYLEEPERPNEPEEIELPF